MEINHRRGGLFILLQGGRTGRSSVHWCKYSTVTDAFASTSPARGNTISVLNELLFIVYRSLPWCHPSALWCYTGNEHHNSCVSPSSASAKIRKSLRYWIEIFNYAALLRVDTTHPLTWLTSPLYSGWTGSFVSGFDNLVYQLHLNDTTAGMFRMIHRLVLVTVWSICLPLPGTLVVNF